MTINAKEAKQLRESVATMRTYAATLPEGSEERREFDEAIASSEATLRTFAATLPAPVVAVPEAVAAPEATDPEPEDLDPETEEGLAALAESLRADGYDVGDPASLVAPPVTDPAPTAAAPAPVRQFAADPEHTALLREDVDTRVDALVEADRLLPFEGDRVKTACYALLDATPEAAGAPKAGLRVYSRTEAGATPSADRRAAVREILDVLNERETTGLIHRFTREVPEGEALEPVVLTVPEGVEVNQDSAALASRIQAFAKKENIPFAEAVKRYEREHGKVELRRH